MRATSRIRSSRVDPIIRRSVSDGVAVLSRVILLASSATSLIDWSATSSANSLRPVPFNANILTTSSVAGLAKCSLTLMRARSSAALQFSLRRAAEKSSRRLAEEASRVECIATRSSRGVGTCGRSFSSARSIWHGSRRAPREDCGILATRKSRDASSHWP